MPTWPNRPAEFYLAALSNPDPRMRRQACAALEVMGDPRAIAPLLTLLTSDEHEGVRANAARALGTLGDGRAPLLLALRDSSPNVRANAVMALEKLGDRSTVAALTPLLDDPDMTVRYHATRVVGKFGGADQVAPLMARLREDSIASDPTLTFALAAIGQPALDPLLEALRDERPAVRAKAAAALMSFNGRHVRDALTAARQDPNPYARMQVEGALEQIKTRRMLARVERLKAEGTLDQSNILDFLAHRDEYLSDADGEEE
ncbi:MAG TPA: HEAT repeat domain-containing protein [Ktedonobacterales bacterium]